MYVYVTFTNEITQIMYIHVFFISQNRKSFHFVILTHNSKVICPYEMFGSYSIKRSQVSYMYTPTCNDF